MLSSPVGAKVSFRLTPAMVARTTLRTGRSGRAGALAGSFSHRGQERQPQEGAAVDSAGNSLPLALLMALAYDFFAPGTMGRAPRVAAK